jgi:PAS domain S-box-containing protein
MMFKKVWSQYNDFAEAAAGKTDQYEVKDIHYWQRRIYIAFTIYFIPFSFIALIPGVWMSIKSKMFFIAGGDIAAVVIIAVVVFDHRVSLDFKKIFVVIILYLVAIMLISTLGLFGPGVIYLYALTIFSVVMISTKMAYWTILLHFITCLCFGLIIACQPFNSPLFLHNTVGSWIAFSSNLIFLSIISVVLISKTINGLESTILSENQLAKSLQNETREKDILNIQLAGSETYFRSLFMLNPLPMWVFDRETLKVLEVNEAALKGYGYTRDEFLRLSVMDIRQNHDLAAVHKKINNIILNGNKVPATAIHYDKNHMPFPVDVQHNMIYYKGQQAILGIAKNISEEVKYTNAIKAQNNKLRKIAIIQSHLVRAPLARIMGLIGLLKISGGKPADPETLDYLDQSAHELDSVVRRIVSNTDDFKEIENLFPGNES